MQHRTAGLLILCFCFSLSGFFTPSLSAELDLQDIIERRRQAARVFDGRTYHLREQQHPYDGPSYIVEGRITKSEGTLRTVRSRMFLLTAVARTALTDESLYVSYHSFRSPRLSSNPHWVQKLSFPRRKPPEIPVDIGMRYQYRPFFMNDALCPYPLFELNLHPRILEWFAPYITVTRDNGNPDSYVLSLRLRTANDRPVRTKIRYSRRANLFQSIRLIRPGYFSSSTVQLVDTKTESGVRLPVRTREHIEDQKKTEISLVRMGPVATDQGFRLTELEGIPSDADPLEDAPESDASGTNPRLPERASRMETLFKQAGTRGGILMSEIKTSYRNTVPELRKIFRKAPDSYVLTMFMMLGMVEGKAHDPFLRFVEKRRKQGSSFPFVVYTSVLNHLLDGELSNALDVADPLKDVYPFNEIIERAKPLFRLASCERPERFARILDRTFRGHSDRQNIRLIRNWRVWKLLTGDENRLFADRSEAFLQNVLQSVDSRLAAVLCKLVLIKRREKGESAKFIQVNWKKSYLPLAVSLFSTSPPGGMDNVYPSEHLHRFNLPVDLLDGIQLSPKMLLMFAGRSIKNARKRKTLQLARVLKKRLARKNQNRTEKYISRNGWNVGLDTPELIQLIDRLKRWDEHELSQDLLEEVVRLNGLVYQEGLLCGNASADESAVELDEDRANLVSSDRDVYEFVRHGYVKRLDVYLPYADILDIAGERIRTDRADIHDYHLIARMVMEPFDDDERSDYVDHEPGLDEFERTLCAAFAQVTGRKRTVCSGESKEDETGPDGFLDRKPEAYHVFDARERRERALRWLKRGVRQFPRHVVLKEALAGLHYRNENYSKAYTLYRECIENILFENHDVLRPHEFDGTADLTKHDHDLNTQLVRKMRFTTDLTLSDQFAFAAKKANRVNEGVSFLRRLLRQNDASVPACVVARAFYFMGAREKAIDVLRHQFTTSVERHGTDRIFRYTESVGPFLVWLLREIGQTERAMQLLKRAGRVERSNVTHYVFESSADRERAEYYLHERAWAKLKTLLRKVARRTIQRKSVVPFQETAAGCLFDVYRMNERLDRGISLLETWYADERSREILRFRDSSGVHLFETYLENGHPEKALAVLEVGNEELAMKQKNFRSRREEVFETFEGMNAFQLHDALSEHLSLSEEQKADARTWYRQLGRSEYAKREKAHRKLEQLGFAAVMYLRKKYDVRDPERKARLIQLSRLTRTSRLKDILRTIGKRYRDRLTSMEADSADPLK